MSLMSQVRSDLIEYAASLSTEVLISRASIPAHLCALIDERMGIPFDQRTKGANYTAGASIHTWYRTYLKRRASWLGLPQSSYGGRQAIGLDR